jgi:hypothetical protein
MEMCQFVAFSPDKYIAALPGVQSVAKREEDNIPKGQDLSTYELVKAQAHHVAQAGYQPPRQNGPTLAAVTHRSRVFKMRDRIEKWTGYHPVPSRLVTVLGAVFETGFVSLFLRWSNESKETALSPDFVSGAWREVISCIGVSKEMLQLDTTYVELRVVFRMGRITAQAGGSVSDNLRVKDLVKHVYSTHAHAWKGGKDEIPRCTNHYHIVN